jgi:hypothetical protein
MVSCSGTTKALNDPGLPEQNRVGSRLWHVIRVLVWPVGILAAAFGIAAYSSVLPGWWGCYQFRRGDEEQKWSAAQSVHRSNDSLQTEVEAWLLRKMDGTAGETIRARQVLGQVGTARVLPELMRTFTGFDASERENILRILRDDVGGSIDALVAVIGDPRVTEENILLWPYEEIGASMLSRVATLLDDQNERIRATAARVCYAIVVLHGCPVDQAVRVSSRHILRGNPRGRYWCIQLAGQLRKSSAELVPDLIAILRSRAEADRAYELRNAVLTALFWIGVKSQEVYDGIASVLEDSEPFLRLQAVRAWILLEGDIHVAEKTLTEIMWQPDPMSAAGAYELVGSLLPGSLELFSQMVLSLQIPRNNYWYLVTNACNAMAMTKRRDAHAVEVLRDTLKRIKEAESGEQLTLDKLKAQEAILRAIASCETREDAERN